MNSVSQETMGVKEVAFRHAPRSTPGDGGPQHRNTAELGNWGTVRRGPVHRETLCEELNLLWCFPLDQEDRQCSLQSTFPIEYFNSFEVSPNRKCSLPLALPVVLVL